jgi:hypothetical protein
MKGHSRLLTRTLMLPVGIVVLIAGHGIMLYYVSAHMQCESRPERRFAISIGRRRA